MSSTKLMCIVITMLQKQNGATAIGNKHRYFEKCGSTVHEICIQTETYRNIYMLISIAITASLPGAK